MFHREGRTQRGMLNVGEMHTCLVPSESQRLCHNIAQNVAPRPDRPHRAAVDIAAALHNEDMRIAERAVTAEGPLPNKPSIVGIRRFIPYRLNLKNGAQLSE